MSNHKPDPLIQHIAVRVREIRHTTGLSQENYARQIGVHRTVMSQVERAVWNPSVKRLTRLATKMGVSTDDLICTQCASTDDRRRHHQALDTPPVTNQ